MKIYLVGGAVRDQLLNKTVVEKDYVVVGATPTDMMALGFRQVGKDFPVFLHPQTGEEYALARTERKTGEGYTGFAVFADTSVTLEDDLLRRDLTINAIAQDEQGNLIDPYQGLQDLEQRVLRHVSPAFVEDPLRVLRVARFAARFATDGFTIAPDTLALMRELGSSNELATLAAERVWRETEKAMTTASPQVYWQVLEAANALLPWFKELAHGFNDQIFAACIERLSPAAKVNKQVMSSVHWALTCSALSPQQAQLLQQRLRVPNHYQQLVHAMQQADYQISRTIDADWTFQAISKADGWRRPELIEKLLLVWQAQGLSVEGKTQIEHAVNTARGIQAREVMATAAQQGVELTGPAIGEAVRSQQLTAMRAAWLNHSDK